MNLDAYTFYNRKENTKRNGYNNTRSQKEAIILPPFVI